MPVLVGERQKNVEGRGLEWKQGFDIVSHKSHTIRMVAICATNIANPRAAFGLYPATSLPLKLAAVE